MHFRFKCKNCGKDVDREVEKGTVVSRFADDLPPAREYAVACPHCGHLHRVLVEEKPGGRGP